MNQKENCVTESRDTINQYHTGPPMAKKAPIGLLKSLIHAESLYFHHLLNLQQEASIHNSNKIVSSSIINLYLTVDGPPNKIVLKDLRTVLSIPHQNS